MRMSAAMVDSPILLLYLLFWLVVAPSALYSIIRTAFEHGTGVHSLSLNPRSSQLLRSDSRRTPPSGRWP